MPQYGTLDFVLWGLGFLLRVGLLTQIPRAKFLPFYCYILFFIVRDFFLLPVLLFGNVAHYYYLYWSTAFVASGLNLWCGIFIYRQTQKWLTDPERKMYRFALHGLVFFAAVTAVIQPFKYPIDILDRSVSIILVGLYFGIFSLEAVFNISIRPRLRDIAAGFAIYKAVDLMRGALQVHTGAIPYLGQAGFIIALIWWLHVFLKPEPEVFHPKKGEVERVGKLLGTFAERNTPHLVASQKPLSGGE